MNLKNQLLTYLRTNGKTHSWREIYDMFPFKGNDISAKEKSDTVRKIFNRKVKQISTKINDPKILIFDIETAPLKSYVWRLWQQNVHPVNGQLQSEWFMLTWAAKWLFDNKIMSDKLTSKEVLAEDDTRLVKQMWNLFNEANIVIAHNAISFDVRMLNTMFLKAGLTPPSPYQVIDTKVHAKRHLSFESNKLDYIGKVLGLGRKIETDFNLWERCMVGDNNALREMQVYNEQDVKLLEDIYLILRPYIKPHPNLNLIIGNNVSACPTCMSTDLDWNGTYTTYANTFESFTCKCCGSIGRSRKNSTPKEVKQVLTISTPK